MAKRRLVSDRFYKVADECAGKSKVSTTFCTDQLKLCQSDYIAVTLGTRITNCDIFWNFPLTTDKCHGYDRAATTIHEITHVDGLFDPSTVDFADNYGWPKLTYLSGEQAVTNADNYQYYANGE
jgi:deuterolysin